MRAITRVLLLTGLAVASSVANLGTADAASSGRPTGDVYLVRGQDMGPLHNHVRIYLSGEPEAGATVTVNGTPLAHQAGDPGRYSGELPAMLDEGAAVDLVVDIAGQVITGSDVVPEAPVTTAPTDGSTFMDVETIPVAWTSNTDPDHFVMLVQWASTGMYFEVPGTDRTFDLPVAGLPFETVLTILVMAYNDGVFAGPAEPESEMNIRMESPMLPTVTILTPTPTDLATWGSLKARY